MMFRKSKFLFTVIAFMLALGGCGGSGGSSAVVLDDVPPVISLNGSDAVEIEAGTTYADPGAMADDDVDGDLSGSIVVGGDVILNPTTVGTYTITYDVTDAAGNEAIQVTRIVDVKDRSPVIELAGFASVTIEAGSIYSDAAATATDTVDGDITASIVLGGDQVPNPATVGTYSITYNVTDSASNSALATRTVAVIDTTAPEITVNGAALVSIEAGTSWSDPGALAVDNNDGPVPVILGGTVPNPATVGALGFYTLTYDAVDNAGYAALQKSRKVTVSDTTAPVITLVGNSPVTVEVNTAYIDAGATAIDNNDGNLTGSIVTVNPVVIGAVDTYIVTYNVTDAEGNIAVQVSRTVDVVDTLPPLITLTGDDPQSIEAGSAYTELGATATDNGDGDISGSIVIDAAGVDTSAVGSYIVTYDVSDTSSNSAATVTRTVIVSDNVAPVITLTGADPQTIEVATPYSELDATASDSFDGDLSSSIAIDASGVDTAVVGSYSVTYNVTDANGNPATTVTRTVEVVDTTPPVITLNGPSSLSLHIGTPDYTDQGATAFDNYDGDLSGSIFAVDLVDVNTLGSYDVTYDVTDANGNVAATVTRTVEVVDTTAPIITMLGSETVSFEADSSWSDPGATAWDIVDEAVGVISAGSVNPAVAGTYVITYDALDSSSNWADQVTRTVIVAAAANPVIILAGFNPQTIEVGGAYLELGATASDNFDGDISADVVIDATSVNPGLVGSYSVSYDVQDAAGHAATQVVRTVNVVDTTKPVISLVGGSLVIVEVGGSYTDAGATANDNYDGVITPAIVTVNPVDVNTVGTYTVTYNVTDANSNAADQMTRTVNVVDTTAPVITLSGDNPQTVEVGALYNELGATAIDSYEGDISIRIVIDRGTLNVNQVGSYSVTYDVTDSEGNVATRQIRTVNVVDTTGPVITLNGIFPLTLEVGTLWADPGATAVDANDGAVAVTVSGDAVPSPATVGSYGVIYTATDATGNSSQQTRTVTVLDTTPPVLTLNGSAAVTIDAGTVWNDPGATAVDANDGVVVISVNNPVPVPAAVGDYTVTYNAQDAAGNPATPVTRAVTVDDTTPPNITLIGDAVIAIEAGSAWSDPGATATDTNDGDLTASIVVSGKVNPAKLGSYTIDYDVTDAAGNVAVTVKRLVDVVNFPHVSTTVPAAGSVAVPPDSNVTITWDLAIDCSTVDETSITSDSPGWHFISCADNYAIFSSSGQDYATQYQVNVTAVVTSIVGTPMAAAESFSYTVTDPPPTWLGTELLGGAGDDISNLGTTDAAGNMYVVGSTESAVIGTNQGGSDIFVVKYAPSGAVLWELQFGGIDDDVANGVVVAGSSVYVVGDTFSALGAAVPGDTLGGLDGFLAKIDADAGGAPQWVRQFGTDGSDVAWSVAVDSGGSIYISGVTDGVLAGGGAAGDDDAFLCRFEDAIDSDGLDGTRTWVSQYGFDITTEDAVSVAVGQDGLIYVAGESGANDLNGDAYAASYSTDGTLVGGPWLLGQATDTDYANALVLDGSGNIYLAGLTATDIDGDGIGVQGVSDAFLAKIDPNAETPVQWARVVASDDYDEAFGVDVDAFGNLYVTGEVDGDVFGANNGWTGSGDIFTGRYTLDGSRNWLDLLGTAGNDVGYDLFLGGQGMVFVIGATTGDLDGVPNAGLNDAVMLRYTSGGVLE